MSLDVSRAEAHPHEAHGRLEHARSSRLAQLRALEETGQTADDHLLSTQKTAVERVLKEIEEAFARIEDGTYGICLGCAKPVPAERLEILPYTRYCVACRRRAA
ncbi:TraR/DksA C4-type zinc finger protein [Streptomyces sp. SP18CS02]|uniref:TraR/DksA C4-type zinc finger protein n=1 Tax=Streptomyces sp. SP18CS02 TaxID=3002531 RepID=UPI002E75B9BD|nr:TraR/DksA C4-type zinc finger protein [Streptomyces sp. SP18CS02]MEE1752813.1 TraR/DksA C4-type zinc finger protein [Streptomyces sp. SP18CS02]